MNCSLYPEAGARRLDDESETTNDLHDLRTTGEK
jgi:hypothetical protein